MNFLAYDVETANFRNIGSICSVGWALVHGTDIIRSGSSLINPCTSFSKRNIAIHGIHESDVLDAPTFKEYWFDTLKPLMSNTVVIAHNARFDISSTEQALHHFGIEDPGIEYVDFLAVCRKLLPDFPHHSLEYLASRFGINFDLHCAEEDACAIIDIAHSICDHYGYSDISELVIRSHVQAENSLSNNYVPRNISASDIISRRKERYSGQCAQVDDSLKDYVICISGDIHNYSRSDVERMILERGGVFKTGVSNQINCLVVGSYSDYPSGYISSKHQKALDLIQSGSRIEIMCADRFLSLIHSSEAREKEDLV